MLPFVATGALAIGAYLVWSFQKRKLKGHLPFPPGPPGLPIIGNAFQIPQKEEWLGDCGDAGGLAASGLNDFSMRVERDADMSCTAEWEGGWCM